MTRIGYLPGEIELFKELYDGDSSPEVVQFIVETLNNEFHKGQYVRNKRSVSYLIKKLKLDVKSGDEYESDWR